MPIHVLVGMERPGLESSKYDHLSRIPSPLDDFPKIPPSRHHFELDEYGLTDLLPPPCIRLICYATFLQSQVCHFATVVIIEVERIKQISKIVWWPLGPRIFSRLSQNHIHSIVVETHAQEKFPIPATKIRLWRQVDEAVFENGQHELGDGTLVVDCQGLDSQLGFC
jgi:hypothetical protein